MAGRPGPLPCGQNRLSARPERLLLQPHLFASCVRTGTGFGLSWTPSLEQVCLPVTPPSSPLPVQVTGFQLKGLKGTLRGGSCNVSGQLCCQVTAPTPQAVSGFAPSPEMLAPLLLRNCFASRTLKGSELLSIYCNFRSYPITVIFLPC